MKKIEGFVVVAADGYLLLHTIRGTKKEAIQTYESFYNTNWEDARANNYQVIKVAINPAK